MDVFPAIDAPAYGFEDSPQADIDVVNMGDGYELRRPKGINYLSYTWPLTWESLSYTVARQTLTWLTVRLKLTPFLWTHPISGVVYQVVCTEARLAYNQFDDEILTATFKQDFNPA